MITKDIARALEKAATTILEADGWILTDSSSDQMCFQKGGMKTYLSNSYLWFDAPDDA